MFVIEQLNNAVAFLKGDSQSAPRLGLVLTSGLGAFLSQHARSIPYSKIPNFPRSTVPGHAGNLLLGEFEGIEFAALQGRVHFYEGYSMEQVVFPARVLARLGVGHLLVTNAAGAINSGFKPGDLMLLTDHINLMGVNPLIGPNEDSLGPRFPDMSVPYDRTLQDVLLRAAEAVTQRLHLGVYAALTGPAYETPAEVRMLERLGADVVGMSTVPEVLAAHHMGVKVVGLSMVSNLAAGRSGEKLDHTEVLETVRQVQPKFDQLLRQFFICFREQGL